MCDTERASTGIGTELSCGESTFAIEYRCARAEKEKVVNAMLVVADAQGVVATMLRSAIQVNIEQFFF